MGGRVKSWTAVIYDAAAVAVAVVMAWRCGRGGGRGEGGGGAFDPRVAEPKGGELSLAGLEGGVRVVGVLGVV